MRSKGVLSELLPPTELYFIAAQTALKHITLPYPLMITLCTVIVSTLRLWICSIEMTVVPVQIILNATQIRDERVVSFITLYIHSLVRSEMLQTSRLSLRKLVFNMWILFKEIRIQ